MTTEQLKGLGCLGLLIVGGLLWFMSGGGSGGGGGSGFFRTVDIHNVVGTWKNNGLKNSEGIDLTLVFRSDGSYTAYQRKNMDASWALDHQGTWITKAQHYVDNGESYEAVYLKHDAMFPDSMVHDKEVLRQGGLGSHGLLFDFGKESDATSPP